jgi:hypothetical protein
VSVSVSDVVLGKLTFSGADEGMTEEIRAAVINVV